jgi:uncharacterized protein YifE (UPF0438 family)
MLALKCQIVMNKSNKLKYKSSIKIQYKGCLYHSLLELKFVLLIEDKCSWIREPVAIHYDPETLEVTNYINENTKKYTPDFLVRKWHNNTGHLIEIKPKKFLDSELMHIRKVVTENYLKKKNVDWKYKILTEDDIILTQDKLELLQQIIGNNKYLKAKLNLIKKDKRYNNAPQRFFYNTPYLISKDITTEDYKRYVKYGILPTSQEEVNLILEEQIEYSSKSNSLDDKAEHFKFLNKKFKINCSSEIFTQEEISLLEKYGSWLNALFSGEIKPVTKQQENIIAIIKKGDIPENAIAKVWYKYIKRVDIEKRLGDKLKVRYQPENNDFFKREDYYKMHKNRKINK